MALNPYTLNHLYQKGILDYVPTDLIGGLPVAPLTAMSNPYLDLATQGGLYQGAINGVDSFTPANNVNVQAYNGVGSMSNAGGLNSFIGNGVGTQNNSSIANTFGFNNTVGNNSNAGFYNSFMGNGVGEQYQGGGLKIFGGFSDTKNSLNSGFNKTVSVINNTPKIVLGLIAGTIGTIGIMTAFKKGKKPLKSIITNFLSKLNPINWFKKK